MHVYCWILSLYFFFCSLLHRCDSKGFSKFDRYPMASFEKSEKDTALDKAAEDILETLANDLMNQIPKIDAALKNLIAYYLGHQQIHGGKDASTLMPSVLKVIQTLSKAIQSTDLIPPQEWTAKIPQGDKSANERLDAIAKYKVIYTMRNKIISSGNKIIKTFSYDYFDGTKYLWKDLKENVLTTLSSSSSPAVLEIAEEILELFENSLSSSISSIPVDTNEGDSDIKDQTRELRMRLGLDVSTSAIEMKELSDLIWATDFNEALRVRSEKRVSSISERLKKEEEEEKDQERQQHHPRVDTSSSDKYSGSCSNSQVEEITD